MCDLKLIFFSKAESTVDVIVLKIFSLHFMMHCSDANRLLK